MIATKINTKVEVLLDNEWFELSKRDLNNETLHIPYYPLQMDDTLDETLDKLSFETISVRKELYPRYMPCKVTITELATGDNIVRYYLVNDSVKVWRLMKPMYYTHKFSGIELTKMLERVLVYGKAFTQPLDGSVRYYMDDIVDILLATSPLREVGEKPLYKLDESVREKLHNAVPTEFQWSNRVTLYEALAEVGRCVNGIPRLIPNTEDDRIFDTVTFDFYDDYKGEIEQLNWDDYEADCVDDYFCNELVTSAENLTTDNIVVVPSASGWVSPRYDTVKRDDVSAYIDTTLDIDKIQKVLICLENLPASFTKNYGTIGAYTETGTVSGVCDITDHILEEAEWELLPTDLPFVIGERYEKPPACKANRLYYKRGNNKIENIHKTYKDAIIFSEVALFNLIDSVFYNCAEDKNQEIILYKKNGETLSSNDCNQMLIDGREINNIKFPPPSKFRVEFISFYQNAICTSVNNEIRGFNQQVFNQSTEIAKSDKLGRLANNIVQRLGNEEVVCTVTYDHIADIPSIGQTYQGYVVTNMSYHMRGVLDVLCLFKLSKNYTKVNEYIGIDRKYRALNIPQNYIQRNIHKDIHISFGNEQRPIKDNLARLEDIFNSRAFVLGNYTAMGLTLSDKQLALPCAKYEYGSSVLFYTKAFDNIRAGRVVKGLVNKDILYTDNQGYLTNCNLSLVDHSEYEIDNFPLSTFNINNKVNCDLYVNKDALERLAFEFQIHFVNEDGYMFTDKFSKSCLTGSFMKDKVYWLSKPINKSSVKIDANAVSTNKSFDELLYKNYETGSYCITDGVEWRKCYGWVVADNDGFILLGHLFEKDFNNYGDFFHLNIE